MGYYVNKDSRGVSIGVSAREKCSSLLKDGAVEVAGTEFQDNLVCVVDNGFMAAAAYAYSEREFEDFSMPSDKRPKRWFIYEHAKKGSGYGE